MAKELTEAYGSPLMVSGFVVHAGPSGLAAAGAVILLFYALQEGDVVVVAPVVASNPLTTLVLAHLFIARLEKVTRQLVVGTALTVLGVLIVVAGSAA